MREDRSKLGEWEERLTEKEPDLYDGVTPEGITLEYRKCVINDLLDNVREFLTFSNLREMNKLIAKEL